MIKREQSWCGWAIAYKQKMEPNSSLDYRTFCVWIFAIIDCTVTDSFFSSYFFTFEDIFLFKFGLFKWEHEKSVWKSFVFFLFIYFHEYQTVAGILLRLLLLLSPRKASFCSSSICVRVHGKCVWKSFVFFLFIYFHKYRPAGLTICRWRTCSAVPARKQRRIRLKFSVFWVIKVASSSTYCACVSVNTLAFSPLKTLAIFDDICLLKIGRIGTVWSRAFAADF